MPKSENPRNCPFCHNDNLAVLVEKNQTRFYIMCENIDCGARGPSADSFEEAIIVWNGM